MRAPCRAAGQGSCKQHAHYAQAKRLGARHAHVIKPIGHGIDDDGDSILLQELGVCDLHDVLSSSKSGRCVPRTT